MANTFTQIYVHIVFAVQGKQNVIYESIRERIEKYMCGTISNNQSKPISIYCNPDHVHVLVGLHPSISISDMARDIKAGSSKFINENSLKVNSDGKKVMVLLRIQNLKLIPWQNTFLANLSIIGKRVLKKNTLTYYIIWILNMMTDTF